MGGGDCVNKRRPDKVVSMKSTDKDPRTLSPEERISKVSKELEKTDQENTFFRDKSIEKHIELLKKNLEQQEQEERDLVASLDKKDSVLEKMSV